MIIMIYFVTGAYGWLGSRFVDELTDKGKAVSIFLGDLTQEEEVQQSIPNDEFIIVNFAGNKDNDVERSIRNNIIVTSQLARVAQRANCKCFIHISSIACIGSTNKLIDSETECCPDNNYGKSKEICELIIKKFVSDYVIVRPTNIVDGSKVGILKKIYQAIRDSQVFEVWRESLDSMRDYISVQDVIDAVVNLALALEQGKNFTPRIVNLCSGYSYSMGDIITMVERQTGCRIRTNILSNPDFRPYNLIVDASDVFKLLGREPESLEDIVNKIKL